MNSRSSRAKGKHNEGTTRVQLRLAEVSRDAPAERFFDFAESAPLSRRG